MGSRELQWKGYLNEHRQPVNGRWAREGLTVFTKVRDQVLGTLFLASKCHALSPATNDLPFFGPMKRGCVCRTRIATNTDGEQSWKQSQSRSYFIFNHEGLGVFCFFKKKKWSVSWENANLHSKTHAMLCTLLVTRMMSCLSGNVSLGIKAVQTTAKDK